MFDSVSSFLVLFLLDNVALVQSVDGTLQEVTPIVYHCFFFLFALITRTRGRVGSLFSVVDDNSHLHLFIVHVFFFLDDPAN